MQPFSWRNGAVVLVTGAVWYVTELVPHNTGIWWRVGADVALRSTAITVLFLTAMYVLNLSPDANELLNGVWKRVKKIVV
jgi:hypothetical protein